MMVAYVWATKCERAAACRSAFAAASGSAGSGSGSAASASFSFLGSSRPPMSSSSWPSASSASGRGPSGASSGLSETGAGVAVEGSRDESFGAGSSVMLVSGGRVSVCVQCVCVWTDGRSMCCWARNVPWSSALACAGPSSEVSCAGALAVASADILVQWCRGAVCSGAGGGRAKADSESSELTARARSGAGRRCGAGADGRAGRNGGLALRGVAAPNGRGGRGRCECASASSSSRPKFPGAIRSSRSQRHVQSTPALPSQP